MSVDPLFGKGLICPEFICARSRQTNHLDERCQCSVMIVWKSLDIIVNILIWKGLLQVCNNIDVALICAHCIIHLDRYFFLFVHLCSATRWILTKSSRCDRINLRIFNVISIESWTRSILLLMQCVIESKYIDLLSRCIMECPQKVYWYNDLYIDQSTFVCLLLGDIIPTIYQHTNSIIMLTWFKRGHTAQHAKVTVSTQWV